MSAYLFTYPLVVNYGGMYRRAIEPMSEGISGGFGSWHHTVMTEQRSGGAGRPYADVVYSSNWLDLRSEPWRCAIGPVSPEVSFGAQIVDLWGFLVHQCAVGHRATGPVLIARPERVRNVPDDVAKLVAGESEFVVLLTETRWRDPFKLHGEVPIQPEIALEPVSAFRSTAAPPAPAMRWWPWSDSVQFTDAYWSFANFALSLTTAHDADRPILERIAEIGVVAGAPWDPSVLSDAVTDAIQHGMDDALSDLLEAAADPGASRLAHVRRAEMDRDYFGRALGALSLSARLSA